MWAALAKKLAAFAGLLASLVLGLVALWASVRKSAKAEADAAYAGNELRRVKRQASQKIEVERQANERQLEAVQNANEVISDNSAISDDDVVKRLRDNWRRLES